MNWIPPGEKDTGNQSLEDQLWAAADRSARTLNPSSGQYSEAVLGLISLPFAGIQFVARRALRSPHTAAWCR